MTDLDIDLHAHRYLNLLKRSHSGTVHEREVEFRRVTRARGLSSRVAILINRFLSRHQIVKVEHVSDEQRRTGKIWPSHAESMIGNVRLDNLQELVVACVRDGIEGDFIETGVWRGGSTILMTAVLQCLDASDRLVWVADSFKGLPPPDPENYPQDDGDKHHTFDELAVSLEQVRANFERYDLMLANVRFLKGWFKDTLPGLESERLALIRLDGDMYESTMDALVHLYPKLSPGGYLIVDDFGAIKQCAEAVHDYRQMNDISENIIPIDWTGVYWQKSKDGSRQRPPP